MSPAEPGPLLRVRLGSGPRDGYVLPASSVAATSTPGALARSAHAPDGILGITGLRGQVYTVVDMNRVANDEPLAAPQEGWLSIVAPSFGAGWGLLWSNMLGMADPTGWRRLGRPFGSPEWLTEIWETPEGEQWREVDVAALLARWAAPPG